MNNNTPFDEKELELSDEIMRFSLRTAANDFGFLKNPIFSLKPVPTDKTESIGADYSKLYYNPKWLIEQFRRNKNKTVNAIVHCVLHCLYLHPSMVSVEDDIFDTAADMAILIMMYNAGAVKLNVGSNFINDIVNTCGSTSTSDIFKAAKDNAEFLNKISLVTNKHKWDDHNLWYLKDEEENKNSDPENSGSPGAENPVMISIDISDMENPLSGDENGAPDTEEESSSQDGGAVNSGSASEEVDTGMKEEDWSSMLVLAKAAAQSQSYGSQHGNMFMEVKKPDRFSRFSYREYLRRFAMSEIVSEDPETIDMMMYTAGFELYDDITLIEFSELKEQATASDIIIAIDISGSCSGEIAVNFLRQVYSLFEEMDIRSNVNIHALTFDTQIVAKAVIRTAKDAEKLVEEYNKYTDGGWGGTDFNCVFEYADNFKKTNRGKKLKGLFFFSDGYGGFPPEKRSYRTTFFIPVEKQYGFDNDLSFIPDWVECVKYDDNDK